MKKKTKNRSVSSTYLKLTSNNLTDRIQEVGLVCDALKGKSVNDIIQWAFDVFGDDLGIMTALGYSGVVMMDHLKEFKPDFVPHFIDTGFHFPETIQLLKDLEQRWDIQFNVLKPVISLEQLNEILGEKPWNKNPDLCCHFRKIEPLLRVIHDQSAWMSALRRDQSITRKDLDVVEVDARGTIKIHPLAEWTFEQTWDYIRKHDLPYNPLHDQRYFSIGCIYCTSPVAPNEHERAGRWNSMPKMECGLHMREKDDSSFGS